MMNQSKALQSLAEGILQYIERENQEIICPKEEGDVEVPWYKGFLLGRCSCKKD